MPMKQIDLEPHKHTTQLEVTPAPKWVLPVALVVWLLIGFGMFGTDWKPFLFGWCFGGVMLAAVASYPKFFLAKDR